MSKLLVLLLCFCWSLGFAGQYSIWHPLSNQKADNQGFNYQNQIISPLCISQLATLPADHFPKVASVDLGGCENSMTTQQRPIYTDGKASYLFFFNNKVHNQGYFDYKLIGRTSNGLFVIQTASGNHKISIDNKIQIIKLATNHVYYYRNPDPQGQDIKQKQLNIRSRTVMSLIGEVQGALGCQFGIHSATLRGNTLQVGFNFDKNALTAIKKHYDLKVDVTKINQPKPHHCLGEIYFSYNLQNLNTPKFSKIHFN